MKLSKIIYILVTVLFFSSGIAVRAQAKMSAPQPPEQNPHPPQSPADQRRVEFAEQAVRLMLMRAEPKPEVNAKVLVKPMQIIAYANKNRECLLDPTCYRRDTVFVKQIIDLQNQYGLVTEFKHAHIIPWSWQNFQSSTGSASGLARRSPPIKSEANESSFAPNMAEPVAGVPLKPDEYMVHMYVKFKNTTDWFHLDVILSEDSAGNPLLRYFYVAPMMASMPPGVVC